MSRRWLASLCLCLALTGCARAAEPQLYWTIDLEDGALSLREGTKENTLDLALRRDGEETTLRTLVLGTDYSKAEGVSAAPFTDILQRDGFVLRTEWLGGWLRDQYVSVEDGKAVSLAESFGFEEARDWSVDLDGDGQKELVANVTYGGDGARRAYVYQRRADGIWRGSVSLKDVPDFDDRGAASWGTVYDPERNVFQTRYAVKGREETALLETHGLEKMEFHLYEGGA